MDVEVPAAAVIPAADEESSVRLPDRSSGRQRGEPASRGGSKGREERERVGGREEGIEWGEEGEGREERGIVFKYFLIGFLQSCRGSREQEGRGSGRHDSYASIAHAGIRRRRDRRGRREWADGSWGEG
eukprot:765875-Hanusia_phi.AAC.4